MKRFLIGCVAALAVLAASERRASAHGGFGFSIGVNVAFDFKYWGHCHHGGDGYGGCGYHNGYAGGYVNGSHAPVYAGTPGETPAPAPAARPAAYNQPTTQTVGFQFYPSASYSAYNYYAPAYWYGP
jgi:hypothetical protein